MLALRYQLEASARGALEALVLSDDIGLCVAATGAVPHEEIAAHTAMLGRRVESYEGMLRSETSHWNVRIRRFHAEGAALYLCAVGGGGQARADALHHSIGGVARILGS